MNISSELKLELERRARQTKDRHEKLCVILAKSEGMSVELFPQAHRWSELILIWPFSSEFRPTLIRSHRHEWCCRSNSLL